jgi:hypothetical protein
MHLNHFSAKNTTESHCRAEFLKRLKKFGDGTKEIRKIKNQTYVQACADSRKKSCRYVVRVFDSETSGKIQFAHELRVLQKLGDQKVDFVPRVHTAFLCKDYGLLVQDKWDGDVLDLLYKNEHMLEEVYDAAQLMMRELHRAGFSYGKNAIHVKNLIMRRSGGFQLGLQDWSETVPVTEFHAEHDMHCLQTLFSELRVALHAVKNGEPIPEFIPHGIKVKLGRLSKKDL